MIPPHIVLSNGREIGLGRPVYIIAEVSANFGGNPESAALMIATAKDVGADAVLFHSFHPETLINPKRLYHDRWERDPEWEILEEKSLPMEWHQDLKMYADLVGIDFLCVPYDAERLQLLMSLDVAAIPIAAGDVTYHQLLREAGESGKPVFLATGGSTMEEIASAVKVLRDAECMDLVLMQSALESPSQLQEANLLGMVSLLQRFQVLVGYADKTPRSVVSLGAAALGGTVVQKQLTNDKERCGFALDEREFSQMCAQIRQLESALGTGNKEVSSAEEKERFNIRRCLYAAEDIQEGALFTEESLKAVRRCYPEGISASELDELIGQPAKTAIPAHTLITREML